MSRPGYLLLGLAVVLGVLVGVGSYTFVYARGYSYLSDDPAACVNCHIMRDQFASWSVSSHRSVTCNGCHTPHDYARKYLVKAENGFAHSWAFTFEEPQNILIKDHSREVVEENCVECHGQMLEGTFLAGRMGGANCTKCHNDVAHPL